MKTRLARWTRAVAAGLALAACPMLAQAGDDLLPIPLEPQQHTYWCWASVSTMAGHSFKIKVKGQDLSQLDIARFEFLGIETETERRQRAQEIEDHACTATPGECNEPGDVWLFRINGTSPPPGWVLRKERLVHEITVRKRPVILKWDYSSVPVEVAEDHDLPQSEHFVIVTGYDRELDRFRVFDPWSGEDSTAGGNEYWIDYSAYLVPKVYLGQEVFAIHDGDVYNLRRGSNKQLVAQPGSNGLVEQPPVENVVLNPVSFDALGDAQRAVAELIRNRVVVTPDKVRVTEPLSVGRIYPIVVLKTADLARAHERPEVLVTPRTSSVIATVTRAATGEIVDSILLYHEGAEWKEAEHSNTHITRLMETVQSSHPNTDTDPARAYYLVAIPEQSRFYAARGFQGSALLTPLDGDARGTPVSAHEALGKLWTRIEETARRLRHRPANRT